MKISCRETQRLISAYLNDEISDRECAAFLAHVENCPKCMHELETSFMLTYALQYIDSNEKLSTDIGSLLKEKLHKSTVRLRLNRLLSVLMWMMIVTMGIAILFILGSLFFREFLPSAWRDLIDQIERVLFAS